MAIYQLFRTDESGFSWLLKSIIARTHSLHSSQSEFMQRKKKKSIGARSNSLPLTAPEWMIHSQFMVNQIVGGGS